MKKKYPKQEYHNDLFFISYFYEVVKKNENKVIHCIVVEDSPEISRGQHYNMYTSKSENLIGRKI